MYEFPRPSPGPESGADPDEPNSPKKSKKTTAVPASLFVAGGPELKSEPAKTEPKAFGDLLAALTTKESKKPEADSVATKSESATKESSDYETGDGTTVPPEPGAASSEVGVGETHTAIPEINQAQEAKEEPYEREPREPFRYGGEVVIFQREDTPRTTHEATPDVAEAPTEAEPFVAPVFRRQPEQQHQAQTQPEAPEPLASGGGAEVPPVPPFEAPAASAPEPFERPPLVPQVPAESLQPVPETAYAQQSGAALPNMVAPSVRDAERVATRKEVEDAVYKARRSGLGNGLGVGLVIAAYEHFKHRRNEKRQEKRYQQQTKQLNQARKDYRFNTAEQTQKQNDAQRRFESAEKRFANQLAAERRFPNQPATEKVRQRPEQVQPVVEGQPEIPAGHRLDNTSWLSTELDKDGKVVTQPALERGREYYRERDQENMPSAQRNAAAGEVALVAAAMSRSTGVPSSDGMLPPVIPDATVQAAPTGPVSKPKTTNLQVSHPADSQSAQPLWPWLLALAVVIICLIAVLR